MAKLRYEAWSVGLYIAILPQLFENILTKFPFFRKTSIPSPLVS